MVHNFPIFQQRCLMEIYFIDLSTARPREVAKIKTGAPRNWCGLTEGVMQLPKQ
nr:hypothetical protein [uncultured Agrobacterium sp.]